MADFLAALDAVLAHEGGYVHDPADAGGETYCGISRRYQPDWSGWSAIDHARAIGAPIPERSLHPMVREFYRAEFWSLIRGDEIPDQALAGELLEQSVVFGVSRAVGHLQRALNCANGQGARWPDIPRDGEMGALTVAAVHSACRQEFAAIIYKMMSAQQGVYFLDRMDARPQNERFIGWWRRV